MTSDIDECSAETSLCDKNADCKNSDGSHSCICKQGFTGDGRACEGIVTIQFNTVQFDEGGNRKDFVFISGFSVMISPYEFSALSRQILMSVQPKPVRVMSTQTAQTVKVLTAVLVNRDLLEMGQHVKVNQDNQLIRNLFFLFFYQVKRENPPSQIL